ncbi:hypothetical protein LCGC14_1086650 [marine sediment metagenome]|uniref:Polymerase nucleotidyl transferase domain-containing protein n=1 Tax=marine sediment metagenome TaxID=412755 RepID=A0A0F9MDT0_9ZZZZ
MSNEKYLRELLVSQNLTSNQIENLKNQRDVIVEEIEDDIGGNPTLFNAGSFAKGTMIQASYDLDIVLYWANNFTYTPRNLYIEVGSVLQSKGKTPKSKKVGWEIPFQGDFHIDVIPGKKISNKSGYAYLYNKDQDCRFQSSVKKHVTFVRNSRRQDVIRLMKLWKKRKTVPIKTFILEYIIIESCKGISRNYLEPQLNAAFDFIYDKILSRRILDPANSQNVICNDISDEEKHRSRRLANLALDADSWEQVFFDL